VEVVRHQARRENRNLHPLLGEVNERVKLIVVRRVVKYARFLVSAIDDVVTVTTDDEAPGPWHGESVALAQRLKR
jgi:hypothetical protein